MGYYCEEELTVCLAMDYKLGATIGINKAPALRQSNFKQLRCQSFLWALVLCAVSATTTVCTSATAQIRSYPPEVTDLLRDGQELIKQGKLEQARSRFNQVLQSMPKCPEAFHGMGVTYLRQGQNKYAEEALRAALALDPNNESVLNNLGTAAYRQGKLDESIAWYQKALDVTHGQDFSVHVNLGNSFQNKHDQQRAFEHYEQAIKLKSDYAPAYLGLARLYYDQHKFDEAEQEARNAVHFKPDSSLGYYNLGLIQAAKKNYREAQAAFRESLKYETDPNYIAELNRISKQLDTALTASASINLPTPLPVVPVVSDKAQAVAHTETLLKAREWKLAEAELRAVLDKYGPDPVVLNNLGYAYAHQGNRAAYQNAIHAYSQAIKLKHPFPAAQYNLGWVYHLIGDNANAERSFKEAIESGRQSHAVQPLAQNAVGLLMKRKGNLKAADEAYRRALAQSGGELTVAHYNLALVLEKMDRAREAVQEYKAYLNLSPNGVNAKQARSRLHKLLGDES